MSASAAKTVTRTPFKKWCDENVGLLFLIPWIIGFVVFKLYPFATSLFYSFTDMNFFDGITKYGLMNYIYIFTNKKTLTSFIITFRYALITVPLKLIFALFIAYILNFKIKCVNLFRTIYYIPSILGGSVAIAVLWKALFKEDGIINMLLSFIGIQGPSWLADPDYAMVVIIVLRVWQFGSAMVLFLAALKGVPADLYEAATIDGASGVQAFFRITVPMLAPTTFMVVLLSTVNLLKEYALVQGITQGGPGLSTTFIIQYIFDKGFNQMQYGYASAISTVVMIIFALIAFAQFKVNNGGET